MEGSELAGSLSPCVVGDVEKHGGDAVRVSDESIHKQAWSPRNTHLPNHLGACIGHFWNDKELSYQELKAVDLPGSRKKSTLPASRSTSRFQPQLICTTVLAVEA
ncbi:hypothetical protein BHE74_00013429 [Ensete ventricosum]|nr:hypothetical protein GW17_00016034 [Ensete ventricosum]RWW78358.1 hypothetical protein BHE74_00013429 [Ensete ventricosum]RZS00448.1 hypothetical protein BHM03_00030132 [Ensete ventricosum]